jgi:hypothetical protein
VISPCLSNIFLHHVLDEWFGLEVRPRLQGRRTLVRHNTRTSTTAGIGSAWFTKSAAKTVKPPIAIESWSRSSY